MQNLDESFLDMVGLSDMPAEQKSEFLAYAQDQLEYRIGERMSEELTEAQLDEFERLIDGDAAMISSITSVSTQDDPIYQKVLENSEEEAGSTAFLGEFATAKWLSTNCPQYQDIIRDSFSSLRDEIAANSATILANS